VVGRRHRLTRRRPSFRKPDFIATLNPCFPSPFKRSFVAPLRSSRSPPSITRTRHDDDRWRAPRRRRRRRRRRRPATHTSITFCRRRGIHNLRAQKRWKICRASNASVCTGFSPFAAAAAATPATGGCKDDRIRMKRRTSNRTSTPSHTTKEREEGCREFSSLQIWGIECEGERRREGFFSTLAIWPGRPRSCSFVCVRRQFAFVTDGE